VVSYTKGGTLSEVAKNRVLRRIFGPKMEAEELYVMRSFITSKLHQILLG
jgi:hypothetical protein